jgi:hypothetical protein
MPTIPGRPAAQQERKRLEARRLRAAGLFATGVHQAEVARRLGVSASRPRPSASGIAAGKPAGLRPCAARGRAARRHGCLTSSSPP